MTERRESEVAEWILRRTGLRVPSFRWPLFASELVRLGGGRALTVGDLEADSRLADALVRVLAVGETYLFRHPDHFKALEEFARQRRAAGKVCRVLCAGCASGEEAWSAAAVLARLYPAGGFEVEGWDLDGERVHRAQLGHIRPWSARGGLLGYGEFFTPADEGWTVVERLRRHVTFRQVNLTKELPDGPFFDVVFFRNVAIYWHAETTSRVLAELTTRLAPDALLLPGPSDGQQPGVEWQSERSGELIVFRRGMPERTEFPRPFRTETTQSAAKAHPRFARRNGRASGSAGDPRFRQRKSDEDPRRASHIDRSKRTVEPSRTASTPSTRSTSPERGDAVDVEDRAWQMADRGMAAEALELLSSVPDPTPRGRKLTGILHFQMEAYDPAMRSLRQAVFLQPDDAEARRWLALVYDHLGRPKDAERERRNAHDLHPESPAGHDPAPGWPGGGAA